MDSLGFRCCRTATSSVVQPVVQTFEHDCPDDMRAHTTGCVDQYEYPNKKSARPVHSIALSEAKSSVNLLENTSAPKTSGQRRALVPTPVVGATGMTMT